MIKEKIVSILRNKVFPIAVLTTIFIGVIWLVRVSLESDYFKIGFSVAAGWYLGKAIYLPFGKELHRTITRKIWQMKDRYYQWKEKRG